MRSERNLEKFMTTENQFYGSEAFPDGFEALPTGSKAHPAGSKAFQLALRFSQLVPRLSLLPLRLSQLSQRASLVPWRPFQLLLRPSLLLLRSPPTSLVTVIVSYEAAAQKHEKRIHGLKPNQTVRWAMLGDTALVLYCIPKISPFWDFPILALPPNTIPIGPIH